MLRELNGVIFILSKVGSIERLILPVQAEPSPFQIWNLKTLIL
jgi:hypothetical protein